MTTQHGGAQRSCAQPELRGRQQAFCLRLCDPFCPLQTLAGRLMGGLLPQTVGWLPPASL